MSAQKQCCTNDCNQGRSCPLVLRTQSSVITRIVDFWRVYQLYRRAHSVRYAAARAWGISHGKLPF